MILLSGNAAKEGFEMQLVTRDSRALNKSTIDQQETLSIDRGSIEQTSSLEMQKSRTTLDKTSSTTVLADKSGMTMVDVVTSTLRKDALALSLFQRFVENADGSTLSELMFRLTRSSLEHTKTSMTMVDIQSMGAALGVMLASEKSETIKSSKDSIEGHFVSTTTPVIREADVLALRSSAGAEDLSGFQGVFEDLLRKRFAPTTQEVLDRASSAKDALKDAYMTVSRILGGQKKAAWANALYTDVKGFLDGKRDNPFHKTLAKLEPEALAQYLTDVRHTLSVTKGFANHAERLAEQERKAA